MPKSHAAAIARLAPHYALLALAEAAGPFLQMLALSMVTDALGREEYGRVNVFLMPVQVMFLLMVSWTAPALLTFGKKEWDERGRCGQAVRVRAVLLAVALAVVAVVFYGWSGRWAAYFGMPESSVHLALAYVAALAGSDLLRGLLQVMGRMPVYALSITLERILSAVFIAVLWLKWVPATAMTALAAMALGTVGSVLLCLPFSQPAAWWRGSESWLDRDEVARTVRFCAPMLLVSVGGWLVASVDIYFLKEHGSLGDVGGYQFAYRIMSVLEKFGLAASTVVGPLLIGFATQRRIDPILMLSERILPKLVLLWGIGLAVAAVCGSALIPFCFDREFHDAPRYLAVLLVGLAFSPLLSMHYPLYYGTESTLRLALVTGTIGLTNLVLDAWWVPIAGPIGAAWATSIGYALGVAVLVGTVPIAPRHLLLRQAGLLLPCLAWIGLFQRYPFGTPAVVGLVPLVVVSALQARWMNVFQPGDEAIFAQVGLPRRACTVLAGVGRFLGRSTPAGGTTDAATPS